MNEAKLMAVEIYERFYNRLPLIISELGKHSIARDNALWEAEAVLMVLVDIPDVGDLEEHWMRVREEIKLIK